MLDAQSLRSIGLLFRGINLGFRQEMERALRKDRLGLSYGEVSPMLALLLHPGSNGAQLARRSTMSAQAMNTVLQKLVSKKYIDRRAHPDSLRADSWYLTEEGSAVLERAKKVYEATTARMLSALSERQAKELEQYLLSCAASLGSGNDARKTAASGAHPHPEGHDPIR